MILLMLTLMHGINQLRLGIVMFIDYVYGFNGRFIRVLSNYMYSSAYPFTVYPYLLLVFLFELSRWKIALFGFAEALFHYRAISRASVGVPTPNGYRNFSCCLHPGISGSKLSLPADGVVFGVRSPFSNTCSPTRCRERNGTGLTLGKSSRFARDILVHEAKIVEHVALCEASYSEIFNRYLKQWLICLRASKVYYEVA